MKNPNLRLISWAADTVAPIEDVVEILHVSKKRQSVRSRTINTTCSIYSKVLPDDEWLIFSKHVIIRIN
jgi:hypothetical protein